jgi:hypothetical protein
VDDYEMTCTSLATGYHNPLWLSFCGSIIKKNAKLPKVNEIMDLAQNEQKQKDDVNVLTKEIDSWKGYEYALR